MLSLKRLLDDPVEDSRRQLLGVWTSGKRFQFEDEGLSTGASSLHEGDENLTHIFFMTHRACILSRACSSQSPISWQGPGEDRIGSLAGD